MARRMFELVEDTSNKFWEVWMEGTAVHTRYGRAGTTGQTTVEDSVTRHGTSASFRPYPAVKTERGVPLRELT